MPGFLKQSTASQSRALGPFLDDADFKTAETGLTIANTDIKLVSNGGASANKNSGGGTHRVNGIYGVTFDATDTATVGELEVSVIVAGALPVFDKFFVVEEAVYDALFAASAAGYGTAQTGDSYAVVNSRLPAALTANGNMKSSLVEILTTALTETAGLLAGGFKKFFNVATPTGTVNSLPDAVPGNSAGLPRVSDISTDGDIVAAINAAAPNVNIQKVNSVTIDGDGSTTPWGPV